MTLQSSIRLVVWSRLLGNGGVHTLTLPYMYSRFTLVFLLLYFCLPNVYKTCIWHTLLVSLISFCTVYNAVGHIIIAVEIVSVQDNYTSKNKIKTAHWPKTDCGLAHVFRRLWTYVTGFVTIISCPKGLFGYKQYLLPLWAAKNT